MSQTNPSPLSHSLLNVVLVLVESALTLVLRFDADLRRVVYPLAKADTLVCIRTYLPHTEIYASFTYKGVLLDHEIPAGKRAADVTINAYSHQLIAALIGHSPEQVDGLQMRGPAETVAQIKQFLLQLGVGGMFSSVLGKFRPKKATTPEEKAEKAKKRDERVAKLTQALEEKTLEAERLTAENRKLAIQLKETEGKQKTTFIGFVIASLLAVVLGVLHFFI